jgi:hypothetical protein
MTIAGRNVPLGAIIAAVGGVLAIVSAPLDWAVLKIGDKSEGLNGLDTGMNGGKVEIVLGIIVLLLVAAWILGVKVPALAGKPAIPAGLVVAGALIIVVLALVYFTKTRSDDSLSNIIDLASKVGGSVSLSLGFFAAALGGIAVIVGGGLALLKKA